MAKAKYDPVEPHWPYGSVALLRSDKREGVGGIEAVQHPIHSATKTETGWHVVLDGFFLEQEEFEVDENGESGVCVPWDDEVAAYAQAHDDRAWQLLHGDEGESGPPAGEINDRPQSRNGRAAG